MKAITLHQPWATLIAEGIKTIETRSWAPPSYLIGQRIAIHAGKTIGSRVDNYDAWRPLDSLMIVTGVPTGAIVAMAKLVDACHITDNDGVWAEGASINDGVTLALEVDRYGDFSIGRWLWCLDDIQPLPQPIPARGYQGELYGKVDKSSRHW